MSKKRKRVAFSMRIGYPLIHRKTLKPFEIKGFEKEKSLQRFYQNRRRDLGVNYDFNRNPRSAGCTPLLRGCICFSWGASPRCEVHFHLPRANVSFPCGLGESSKAAVKNRGFFIYSMTMFALTNKAFCSLMRIILYSQLRNKQSERSTAPSRT
jgi:hypothetical protein